MTHIYVAGAGHVGLVNAALLAERGNHVSIYDCGEAKRKAIASGKVPFYEPGLDQRLKSAIGTGFLEVVPDPLPAASMADFSLVAVRQFAATGPSVSPQ